MSIKLPEHHRLLLGAVTDPSSVTGLDNHGWELLVRLARAAGLLGYLAIELERRALLGEIPEGAAKQLRSGLLEAKKRQQMIRWELDRLHCAVRDTEVKFIALKGIAYELAGLPSSEGRILMDLDVLVPRTGLDQAEAVLLDKGWQFYPISVYEEHYYRVWSREIPPMVHKNRKTEIDMHHAITPVVSKLNLDTSLLFEAAVVGKDGRTKILAPVDMTLHCAVNLFHNNEIVDDLRDLLDFSDALSFFGQAPGFWQALIERSNQFGVGKPLFYSLSFARMMLCSPVPERIEYELDQKPGFIARRIMNVLVPATLLPLHPDEPSLYARLARLLLHFRNRWIGMPAHLLVFRVVRKTYVYVTSARSSQQPS